MARLLVVEDEAKVRRSLQKGLEEEGYEVLATDNGDAAIELAGSGRFDCVVLDWMIPGRDGLEVVRGLRAAGSGTPVLMLTARGAVEDRVRGLDRGADDYLAKPFAFAELVARIRALVRRGAASGTELVLKAGDLELDCVRRRLHRQDIELTAREFELLEFLMRHKNQIVTRDMIAREVWHEPAGTMTNVIDVYVNYVRRKIERSGGTPMIETVRGIGYTLRG